MEEGINPAEETETRLLLEACVLCNNADFNGHTILGDPTEGALIVVAAKAGIQKADVENKYPRIGEIPSVLKEAYDHNSHNARWMCCRIYLGLSRGCSAALQPHLPQWQKTEAKRDREGFNTPKNDEIAGQVLRVLGLAYKILPEANKGYSEEVERGLTFIGLVGMIDPPREEALEAVRLCQKAGIKAVMITGDHKLTAVAIAKELKIFKDRDLVLTGAELDPISNEDFNGIVEKATVYARVSPEHKLRIVRALKNKGHIVAMTGDGVNDAPTLKQADIGVAMGITGTEVAKEASDMILADDNYPSTSPN
jgi:Ca2+-transporting ATPase